MYIHGIRAEKLAEGIIMENHLAASDSETHFDRTVTLSQNGKEIEYGIIDGNNIIVFIKAGLEGSCYGYENKYVRIGRALNEKHGCSIIASSNPLGYKTDFAAEMEFIKDYAKKQNFDDYQVYFFGHSNGAALGIINAYQFAEIKKLVCINAPLMINPHLLIRGINGFSGEKMTLVYGSSDASFDMLKLYSELESDKIDFLSIHGADHNFTGCLDLFIQLPGVLLFGDELKSAK